MNFGMAPVAWSNWSWRANWTKRRLKDYEIRYWCEVDIRERQWQQLTPEAQQKLKDGVDMIDQVFDSWGN